MHRLLIPILGLLALPTDALAQRRPERGGPEKLDHFTFAEHEFESPALGREVPFGIYLPAGYDKPENAERRYPLVIWLHGMWEDHRRFHVRGGAKVLDKMAGEGTIPELILVTANGDRSSFYTNGVRSGAWEDAIAKDLLAHVEKTFRVDPRRSHRAIVGVSMGGYGALKIALRNPDKFGVVAAHSAAVLPLDHATLEDRFPWLKRFGGSRRALGAIFGDPLDEKKWRDENLLHIAEQIDPAELDGLKIYMDCGDRDSYGFEAPNRELHEILHRRKVPHTWRLVKGGGHGWRTGYNQRAMVHSLEFIAGAWAAAKGASGLGGLLRGGGGTGKRE